MKAHFFPTTAALFLATSTLALSANATDDWAAIKSLDAGPTTRPRSAEEAASLYRSHAQRQEKQLRAFAKAYPGDARLFELSLRLVRVLQIRAELEGIPAAYEEAGRILNDLEKVATSQEKGEVSFAKLAWKMRGYRTAAQRDPLLAAARKHQMDFPKDDRIASVLAEIGALFGRDIKKQRELLEEAHKLARDPQLKEQIADDLHRIAQVGKPLLITSKDTAGRAFSTAELIGKPVLVVFYAAWSEPSLAVLDTMRGVDAAAVAISLDADVQATSGQLTQRGLNWPLLCDGKGWEGELVRKLGINRLPTVWLLDAAGRLFSLDATEDTAAQIKAASERK